MNIGSVTPARAIREPKPGHTFFFVLDRRGQARFLSTAPVGELPVRGSRTREAWEKAKQKITDIDPRTLSQERAFAAVEPGDGSPLEILHSGRTGGRLPAGRFAFFLRRLRSRHVLLLAVEALFLPITGLAAVLPGPNMLFYILAMVMIIQWQALRGINRLIRRKPTFRAHPLLTEWEDAVEAGDEVRMRGLLPELEKTFGFEKAGRVFGLKT